MNSARSFAKAASLVRLLILVTTVNCTLHVTRTPLTHIPVRIDIGSMHIVSCVSRRKKLNVHVCNSFVFSALCKSRLSLPISLFFFLFSFSNISQIFVPSCFSDTITHNNHTEICQLNTHVIERNETFCK